MVWIWVVVAIKIKECHLDGLITAVLYFFSIKYVCYLHLALSLPVFNDINVQLGCLVICGVVHYNIHYFNIHNFFFVKKNAFHYFRLRLKILLVLANSYLPAFAMRQ
jgi:hypothetical protein